MDTIKDAEPNETPDVGEVTVAEQTPAAAGDSTPTGNLAASKDAEGGPGVTEGALETRTMMRQGI